MKKVRSRYAPSPTGKMHVGNLRTALYEYLISKHAGGDFILRIEDTDQERFVEGATEIIYRTLAKVGIIHDEGPDVGGDYGPYIQSERRGLYKEYAQKLVELFACRCLVAGGNGGYQLLLLGGGLLVCGIDVSEIQRFDYLIHGMYLPK